MVACIIAAYPCSSSFSQTHAQIVLANVKVAKLITQNLNASYPVFKKLSG